MKSFSKYTILILAFCFSQQLLARETILITYAKERVHAQKIKKILNKDVYLPVELIRAKYQAAPCRPQPESIVQICVKDNKKIEFVRFNQEVVQRSLSIFWEGKI